MDRVATGNVNILWKLGLKAYRNVFSTRLSL